jgi:hypothetical protein
LLSLTRLILAIVAVVAVVSACGGGGGDDVKEPGAVLAIAVRLDDRTPAISAYAGDPDEDPLWLPAGLYYIEAMDQEDNVVSLGSVETEGGDPVDLSQPFADAEDVADSLIALAGFLVDVKLAEYTLLEIVSGGFEEPLFDPDVAAAEADFESVLSVFTAIAAHEDAVLAAFADIESRAQISSAVPPAHGLAMPPLQNDDGDMENAKDQMAIVFGLVSRVIDAEAGDHGAAIADIYLDLAEAQNEFEARLADPWGVVGRSDELQRKQDEWRKYAQNLAVQVSAANEDAERQQARDALGEKIRDDLQQWLTDHGAEVTAPNVDRAVAVLVDDIFRSIVGPSGVEPAWIGGYVTAAYDYWYALGYDDWQAAVAATELRACLNEEVAAGSNRAQALADCPMYQYTPAGTPAATVSPTPSTTSSPTAEPAPDTGWIEGYVQGIADQWLSAGYGGIDVAVAADDLRQCLIDAVQSGAGRDEAIGQCPTWVFEPEGTPEPSATDAPASPTPAQTAQPQIVTAIGTFNFTDPGNAIVTDNSISLVFNMAGGSITSGSGHWRLEVEHYCGTEWQSWSGDLSGTYDSSSGTFSGTFSGQSAMLYWHRDDQGGCVQDPSSTPTSGGWTATLSGSTITGDGIYPGFTLTIQ